MTPDGKRKSVGLKVSEAKYEAIEAARGATPRAVWIEAAIDAYLVLPVTVGPSPEHRPAAGALQEPSGAVQAGRVPEARPCKHPSGRIDENSVCQDCGEDVW